MSLVYVFAASSMEAEPISKIAVGSTHLSPARCGENDVVLNIGGMGPRNAKSSAEMALGAHTAVRTARPKPDAVLVIGLCGALTGSLQEGRIVAYTACGSSEASKPLLSCSGTILNAILPLLSSSGIQCHRAVGITSARIATNPNERLSLAQSGAEVVDMETYPILETAAAIGIPTAVLRVVADSVDRILPNLNNALNDAGALDDRKALRVALTSPIRTARLLAANKRAMRSLAPALEIVMKAPCFD